MVEKNVNKQMAEMMLYSGGLKIYTTQKTDIQNAVEAELSDQRFLIHHQATGQSSMANVVIIENGTGNVVACGTGIEPEYIKTNIGNFNYPISMKKQTGSCMKPISVIAPGLETGTITAATVFFDGETTFGKYKPKNYYQGYKGAMTMREAIAISANIPNIKALARIGVDNSIKFCESVGITGLGQEGLALALGGLTHGTTTYNMAGAYSTIANDGVYIEPTFYTKVLDSEDNVYIECKSIEERSHVVMSPQNAYIEKSILQSVVAPGGTATYCYVPGMEVAAKTGTTNNDYDRWLCGFTPYYTAACWFGYEKNATVYYSGNPAGIIWAELMRTIHTGYEPAVFVQPEGIVAANICKATGHVATGHCSSTYVEYFREGTVPSACEGHNSVLICNETGLLASDTCTDVSYAIYPKGLEQEQNAPWSTPYSSTSGPSAYCPGNHEPEVIIEEEPIPVETSVPPPSADQTPVVKSEETPMPEPAPAPAATAGDDIVVTEEPLPPKEAANPAPSNVENTTPTTATSPFENPIPSGDGN